ncbi:MAG: hypothetical protein DBX52_06075 [Clostridiales bacterium]|nr:MAG: hypothetical protein DBX52_06075 [Clostridiales bacterium]
MKQPTPSVINLRELTALAVFAAMMIALQVALAGLPNIELVTLLVILAACRLGWKALLSVFAFIVAEGLLYGFGIWWFNYLYIWPLLVALVMPLRKWSHPVLWAIVAGLFGLLFGTLCSIPYFITGGPGAGFGYIVSGIPFDLVHCAGNFVSVLILFYPLDQVLKKYL